MAVAYTSSFKIRKHQGAHRTAHLKGFDEPIHFGIHGGIRDFYQNKYGKKLEGPDYPATLDHVVAGIAGIVLSVHGKRILLEGKRQFDERLDGVGHDTAAFHVVLSVL